jgi:hypothetical protein
VEQPVIGVAVALGGQQAAPAGAGNRPLQQVDVGLFTGLEHPQLGVDRGQVGHQPIRVRLRAALARSRKIPCGPAVAGLRRIGGWLGLWPLTPGASQDKRVVVVEATGTAGPIVGHGDIPSVGRKEGRLKRTTNAGIETSLRTAGTRPGRTTLSLKLP